MNHRRPEAVIEQPQRWGSEERQNVPPMGYRYERSRGIMSPGLLVTGLAVAGLGALAWYYYGPDFVRYMKIRNM